MEIIDAVCNLKQFWMKECDILGVKTYPDPSDNFDTGTCSTETAIKRHVGTAFGHKTDKRYYTYIAA